MSKTKYNQLSDTQNDKADSGYDSASTDVQGDFKDALKNAEKEFKVYPYRYVVAVLYLLACLAISLQQNTFAPQGCFLTQIYNVPSIMVTMTSLIHMILHAPISFPANYIVDKYGVKAGIVIAAFFCTAGTWIRCLINVGQDGFWFALLGQFCVGIANPFVINSLNKVSANWFYPGDRAAVTSFLSFFSSITGLVGLLMPGIWFNGYTTAGLSGKELQDKLQEGRDIQFQLNLVQAIIITCLMIPNAIFFRERPPTPPCYTASVESEDFKQALKFLSKSRDYLFQCFSFAFFYGSFTLLAVVLNFVLKPFGLGNPVYSSVLSVMPVISGIIGCVLTSMHLKKYQKYKFVLLVCMIGAFASLLFFLIMLFTEQFGLVVPPVFLVGFFMVPLIPVMLEFSCETSFPIGEATVTGFIYALAHIFGGLGGIGLTLLLGDNCEQEDQVQTPDQIKEAKFRSITALSIMLVLFVLGIIMTFFTKEDLKRLRAEKDRRIEDDKSNVSSVNPDITSLE